MWEILKALVRRFEGRRLRPYLCPAGVPTIADGATTYPDGRKVTLQDPPITNNQADEILNYNADLYGRAAGKLSPVLWLEGDAKHSAIADFCFNLGTTRYKASTLRRRVEAGDWEGAAEELQKWVWGGGRRLPGLVARRAAESALIR